MLSFLKKSFSFVSPLPLKESVKAFENVESLFENVKLLEFDQKNEGTYCRIGYYLKENFRPVAYAEAEIFLEVVESNRTHAIGYSKVFVMQIALYTYFILITAILGYVFRLSILILFFGAFMFISFHWLHMVFIAREQLILGIEELLGVA